MNWILSRANSFVDFSCYACCGTVLIDETSLLHLTDKTSVVSFGCFLTFPFTQPCPVSPNSETPMIQCSCGSCFGVFGDR